LLLLLIIPLSCSKDIQNPDDLKPLSDDDVMKRILDLGFSKNDIVDCGDYYLVEGDIAFPKNDSLKSNTAHLKQARSYNVIENYSIIKIYLQPNFTSININLSVALDSAVSEYNKLNSSLIFIHTTTQSEANIIISKNDNIRFINGEELEICGRGGFPDTDGNPYGIVYISEKTLIDNYILLHSQLVFLLAHELGHNIGLRHTNWYVNEYEDPTGAIQIAGTPTSDASSVMNSATCGYPWDGFSTYDEIAIKTLYPLNVKCSFDLYSSNDKAITLDYNGDGFDDILFYRPGSGFVYLNSSRGDGTFSHVFGSIGLAGYDFSSTADQAISIDYNGDGKDDILCYRPGTKFVYLLRSNGNGTFTEVFSSSNGIGTFDFNSAYDKAIALDYNGDGYDDILCYRPGSKIVYLLKSNGTATFTKVYSSSNGIGTYDFNSTYDKAVSLDYNGDGKEDILCYRPGSKIVYLLKSNGTTSFTAVYSSSNGIGTYDFNSTVDKAIALDYNGDGYDEIMCYRPGYGIVYLLKSNGTAAYVPEIVSSTGIATYDMSSINDKIISLDYNHDGSSDIIMYRPGFGIAYSAHSNGTSFILDYPAN